MILQRVVLPYITIAALTIVVARFAPPSFYLAGQIILLVAALVVTAWPVVGVRVLATAGGRKAPGPWPAMGWALLVFLLIMAVRIPLYVATRGIWDKAVIYTLVFAVAFRVYGRDREWLGLGGKYLDRYLLAGLVMAVFVWVVIEGLTGLYYFLGAHGVSATWYGSWSPVIVPNLVIFGIGNLAEELFFRAFLLRSWRGFLGVLPATALAALLFGLYHINYNLSPLDFGAMGSYVVFAATFGVGMGLIFQEFGHIVPSTVAHVLYNTTIASGFYTFDFRAQSIWLPATVGFTVYYGLELLIFIFVLPRVARRLRLALDLPAVEGER